MYADARALTQRVLLEGPGYMGIIAADVQGQPGLGHAFNVQNINGQVVFHDGQTNQVLGPQELSRFSNLRLFDTG